MLNTNKHPGVKRETQSAVTRGGFTLLEVMVASASATILLVGLASSVFVVSQAFDSSDVTMVRNLDAGFAADDILSDLQFATRFTERTATAVTFKVPDRNGDGADETIRYAWAGSAGDPLTKELNGSAPVSILDDVAALNLEYFTRTMTGLESPSTFIQEVVFEGFAETRLTKSEAEIAIEIPQDTAIGDLLIAAIALDGEAASSFTSPVTGWTLAALEGQEGDVALGVWWRIANGSEPNEYSFTFDDDSRAYGWIMRFTGHDDSDPISSAETNSGKSSFPEAPAAMIPSDNSMVLRIGAFLGDEVSTDDPGVSDHTAITMDEANDFSGGAAFQSDVGQSSGARAYFRTKEWNPFVTATVVIKPSLEEP